jgi:hypothetical protein
MSRSSSGRGDGYRRRWPRSRAGGCLLWILLLIVILIVLSLMFGGFRKGTKAIEQPNHPYRPVTISVIVQA